MKNILITGATGSVGSELVKILAKENNFSIKIAARNIEKASYQQGEVVKFDFNDVNTYPNVLESVHSVFLLPPVLPTMANTVGQFLEYISSKSKVNEIVYLSGLNFNSNGNGFDKLHGDTVEVLKRTNIPFTIIEPVEFMKNYINHILNPEQNPAISFAQGDAKKSLIAHRDIAEVAAKTLNEGLHTNEVIRISGYDYDNYELAQIITRLTGHKVSYQDISLEDLKNKLLNYSLPNWLVECLVELNRDIADGKNIVSNKRTIDILGRLPRTFDEFVIEELAKEK
jgi:uncharacterized protein YbjT (DUF2867 family)